MMSVRQLIEELQAIPEEDKGLEIMTYDYESGDYVSLESPATSVAPSYCNPRGCRFVRLG